MQWTSLPNRSTEMLEPCHHDDLDSNQWHNVSTSSENASSHSHLTGNWRGSPSSNDCTIARPCKTRAYISGLWTSLLNYLCKTQTELHLKKELEVNIGKSHWYVITLSSKNGSNFDVSKSTPLSTCALTLVFGPLQMAVPRDTREWALDCCPEISFHTTWVIIRLHLCFSQWSCLVNPLIAFPCLSCTGTAKLNRQWPSFI